MALNHFEWSAAAAALALAISWLVGRHAARLGRLFGLLDFPDPSGGRKRHDRITPLVGGFPILPVVIVVLAFNFFGDGLRDAADPYT